MKLVESKHKYSASKVLRFSEVTFHFKCIVLWLYSTMLEFFEKF